MLYLRDIPLKEIIKIAPIFPQNGKKSLTLNQAVQQSDATIIINGGTFNMVTYALDTGLKYDGVMYHKRESHGLGISRNNGTYKVEWSYGGNWTSSWIGMYQTGYLNGKVQGTPITNKRGRTAIGCTDAGLTILCLEDGTKEQMATTPMFQQYFSHCTAAINLDGGGSVQYHTPINHLSTGRALPYFIGIWLTPEYLKKLFEGQTYRVNVKTSLNIRKSSNSVSAVIGSYKNKEVVKIISIKNNYGQTDRGWVSMNYLEPISNETPTTYTAPISTTYTVYNVKTYLAVRSAPKISGYSELGKLYQGDKVQVVEFNGLYAKIIFGNNYYGYVTKAYLKKV